VNPTESYNLRSCYYGVAEVLSPDEARFWAKVQRTDGCWLWTASRSGGRRGKSYGQFTTTVDGKQRHHGAHVYAYETAFGPVPPGLEVMHKCNQPLCVRPAHLGAGTHLQNVRGAAADGLYHVPRPGKQKVTDAQCEDIIALRRAGMTLEAIGARYGVSKGFVSRVLHGSLRQYRQSTQQRKAS
jgi:hypothetical protein